VATLASPSTSPELTPRSSAPAAEEVDQSTYWEPTTRIAFRFCFVYFGLYVLTTQMLPGMTLLLPDFGVLPPMRNVFLWIGRHILGIAAPISYRTTGSGDKTFNWVQAFSLLLIAATTTAIWSALARRTTHHAKLFAWFRVFMRLALATTFFSYGFSKLIPLQMPTLALTRLVEPFGNFSPMGVLWYSVGVSPAYEIATGAAEVLAGVLLFVPRIATLGAVVGLMDATMIFLLNMTYDVPVKLFSFHLILMLLFLLAPNARNLFDLFVQHQVTTVRCEPALARSRALHRRLVLAQIVYGLFLGGMNLWQGIRSWHTFGAGAPKSPLYGIWEVEEMSVHGMLRPALLSDSARWKRVIFQTPTAASFQRMDDTFRRYGVAIDTGAKQLTLSAAGDSSAAKWSLAYQRPDHEHLLIDGVMDGTTMHLGLRFRDPDSFLQRSRGFNWVQEVPFNR
jgi:hypothetical protein